MRLKWLPVRLRRRRRVSRMAIDFASVRRPATSLHFCGGPANVSCPRPTRASWVGASVLARRTYSPASLALRGATEESLCCESFARCGAGLSGLGPRPSVGSRDVHCVQWAPTVLLFRRVGRSHLASQSLVPGWPHPTRLETRTKECNMRASLGVANPSAQ